METNGNNRHLMNGYSEIFNVSELCARKFFKYYYIIFTSNSIEVDDLIQEAYLRVLETIRKFPDKPYTEVFRLANKAVSWRLKDLYNGSKKTFKFKSEDLDNGEEDEEVDEVTEHEVKRVSYNDNLTSNYFKEAEKSHRFHFEELLAVLDDNEYEVISKVIKQNRSYQSIALEREVSRQYIEKVYKTAVRKAKKYLEIQP